MRTLAALALGLLAGTSLVPAVASAGDLAAAQPAARPGDQIQAQNEPAPGQSVAWGTALGVVDAPVQSVGKVVADYAHYAEFLPHFKTSRVLSRRGDDALVYMEAGIIKDTVTLWAQIRITAHTEGESRVIEARMLKGNMDAFRARWELTPVAGNTRTLVRFQILVDPGLPLPSSVFDHENEKSANRALHSLRDRVVNLGVAVASNR